MRDCFSASSWIGENGFIETVNGLRRARNASPKLRVFRDTRSRGHQSDSEIQPALPQAIALYTGHFADRENTL